MVIHCSRPDSLLYPHLQVLKRAMLLLFSHILEAAFRLAIWLCLMGKRDPQAFAQALMMSGYNSGDPRTGGRAGFAKSLIDIINAVKGRMEC